MNLATHLSPGSKSGMCLPGSVRETILHCNIKKRTYTKIRDLIVIQSIDFELVSFSV